MQPNGFVDYYEVLQVSPSVDSETLQRVFRHLARRYHPDNKESGEARAFEQVVEAYKILSDPEKRAAFDVQHREAQGLMWKIFDQPESAQGIQLEKRKRQGILALLYTKRRQDQENAGVRIRELEELLGCAREELEFSLWYLRENGLVMRTDYGHFLITAKGVDEAEKSGDSRIEQFKLLPSPAGPEQRQQGGPSR